MLSYKEDLIRFISETYNIKVKDITSAKRGFFGETWRVKSSPRDLFIKIDYWNSHKEIYKRSFPIIEYINQNGIDYIIKIVKTKDNELYSKFNSGVVGMFEYVEGENTEDYPLGKLFEKLIPIYKLKIDNLTIEKENFNTNIDNYIRLVNELTCINTKSSKEILNLLNSKESLIEHYKKRLNIFSERCKADLSNFYITHGDAGGNCILNGDNFTIIDWDYPKLASIERDAWFFMWNTKQIDIINTLLQKNNFNTLNIDRFCFYCYYSFFYYLTEYFQIYFDLQLEDKRFEFVSRIKNYFSSWIFSQLEAADKCL